MLLHTGPRQAGSLHTHLGVSRPYVYTLLNELLELGLVIREDPPGKPARFVPAHPFSLQEVLKQRKSKIETAEQTLTGIMGSLVSGFSLSTKVPGIRILPHIEGLTALYQDILLTKTDICLIRSTKDDGAEDRQALVLAQIQRQVTAGIHTRMISPLPTNITAVTLSLRDQSRLTARRILPRERFSLPAQILIYGDKVGITSYEDTLLTTIIQNEAIKQTMQTLFEFLWETAEIPYK